MSLNRVVLVGRLTKDPEMKYSQSGTAVCRFTLAVNRQFKKDGQDEADFISVICFNKTAENLVNYQKKGALIGVDGRIQTGKYQNADNQTVFTTDVVADSIQFLSSKNDNQQTAQAQQPVQQQQYQQPTQQQFNAYGGIPQQQQQYQQPMSPQQAQQFTQQMGAVVIDESKLPF